MRKTILILVLLVVGGCTRNNAVNQTITAVEPVKRCLATADDSCVIDLLYFPDPKRRDTERRNLMEMYKVVSGDLGDITLLEKPSRPPDQKWERLGLLAGTLEFWKAHPTQHMYTWAANSKKRGDILVRVGLADVDGRLVIQQFDILLPIEDRAANERLKMEVIKVLQRNAPELVVGVPN